MISESPASADGWPSPTRAEAPLVTVVVACYRHERFVKQALDAVVAQTYSRIFLIVTDDASPDSSVDVIDEFLATYEGKSLLIRNTQNLGLCATLNEARKHIRGEYVAFISADDWMEPQRIERQVRTLEVLGHSYGACYSDAYYANEDGSRRAKTVLQHRFGDEYRPSGYVTPALIAQNFIPAPSVLIRADVLEDVGPYDESLKIEDYDMWLRMSQASLFAFVPEPLVNYRILQGSMYDSLDLKEVREQAIRSYRKHLGRSTELDRVLRGRIADLARGLYRLGRDADETAMDLAPSLGRPPVWANRFVFLMARSGMKWSHLSRIAKIIKRPWSRLSTWV